MQTAALLPISICQVSSCYAPNKSEYFLITRCKYYITQFINVMEMLLTGYYLLTKR